MTIVLMIFIPFLFAILLALLHKKISKVHLGWFVLPIPAILFIYLASFIPEIANGNTFYHSVQWIPSFDINLLTNLDGLSMIFALLITGIGTLVVLYSIYYLSKEESLVNFYIYLLLFMGSMLGVVLSDHLMVLYVFWELTSISSFLLIAFWFHRKGSRYGAQKALLITVSGGIALFVGFLMLYMMTGTFSIQEIIGNIHGYTDHRLFLPAMLLVLLGAFTKSVQFPFHIWLPGAMEAPTPVSAYLHSATMVKAGIYLVARFTPIFGGPIEWFWIVSGAGLITLFWGAFMAIKQTDLKALLAYSTISQLGLIMSLIGMGSIPMVSGQNDSAYTLAMFAALFHLINHSTFKGALFMVVGIIDFQLGTRDIRRLGGLISLMPASFTIALIGSFSMAGIPPFNGFLSKEMFFTALLNIKDLSIFNLDTWGTLFPIIGWVASIFTFVYCLIIVFKTFFGEAHPEKLDKETKEASVGMLISPAILSLAVILIFFFPNVIGGNLIQPAMASVFPHFSMADLGHNISAWHGWNTEIMMTITLIIIGILLYLTMKYWSRVYNTLPEWMTLNHLYDSSLVFAEKSSNKVTKTYMTDTLRHYVAYIMLFLIVAVNIVFFSTGAYSFDMSNDAPVHTYAWIITAVMIIAVTLIIFAKSRMIAIVLNGVLGFSVALFFVIFRAPDLALTQIVVETVTTALFLLCFYFLPDWEQKKDRKGLEKINKKNLLISIGVGLTFTLVALSAKSGQLFDSISSFFEDSDKLAGGLNIVNTVLGDFRAFDTMLEVTVLFIAGIGIYSFIKLSSKKGADNIED